jgi:hypothetical protein
VLEMIIYNRIYSLATGKESEQLSISDIRADHIEYKNGNPYNTVFCVDVESGHFKGLAYFEYNIADFIVFINALKDLYDFKVNAVELNHDLSYGSEIKFELHKTGQVDVTGKLYGGNAGEQSLVFEFITDQTAIKSFVTALHNDFVVNNNYI